MATRSELLEAAHRLTPMIRETRDFGEQHRHLEPRVLAAMHEAQFFRLWIPSDTGGLQTDPTTAMEVVETIAAADGATGWNLMIGSVYGVLASRLDAKTAREIWGDAKSIVAGALRPTGKARIVDGGFIAEGRWSFASGIRNSNWWAAGCVVHDGDTPRKTASGGPETRLVFFPASDGEVIDTWTTGGMRGTGSHDYAIKDLFIPIERTMPADAPSRLPDPLYNLPMMALMDSAMATVPLGIARAAIDAFVAMAGTQDLARFHYRRGEQAGDPGRCRPRRGGARRCAVVALWHGRPSLAGRAGRTHHIDKADGDDATRPCQCDDRRRAGGRPDLFGSGQRIGL